MPAAAGFFVDFDDFDDERLRAARASVAKKFPLINTLAPVSKIPTAARRLKRMKAPIPCRPRPNSPPASVEQAPREWLERYREFWDERFDRLENYLRDVQAKQKKGKRHGRHDR